MSRRNTGGRGRAALFFSVSIASAIVACASVWAVVSSLEESARLAELDSRQTVRVLVAADDLALGVTIERDHLTMKQLPVDYVPQGSVLMRVEQAVGRVPRERILANEFIRHERLADSEAGLGLNAIIPRGMRALSVNISGGSAVSGFVVPGNYVDALVTLQGDADDAVTQTITLLQAVPVLAVVTRPEGGDVRQPSMTVAVTPDQAERLTHAVAQGELTMTLRNDIDVTHVQTHGVVAAELLGGDKGSERLDMGAWLERRAASPEIVVIIEGSDRRVEER